MCLCVHFKFRNKIRMNILLLVLVHLICTLSLQKIPTLFNLFPNKPWFLHVYSTSNLKTPREKEKLLVTSNFSFFRGVFYLFRELSAIFNKFEICCLQTLSVWKSLKSVVWERVKIGSMIYLHVLCCDLHVL